MLASRVIEEVALQCTADLSKTLLRYAYLSHELDALRAVSEHVMQLPLEIQYSRFFNIWYTALLTTRAVSTTSDVQKQQYLRQLGSNCLSLLACA
jgi:hypothetical protein